MNAAVFSGKIVEWYLEYRRRLPWRQTRDPYKIWLSEIILQQTRVVQGLPYYHAFLKKYPTLGALARADEQAVLRLWQGLGYYSRARNLHACAKTVVSSFDGKFPRDVEELRKLKGVGDYTAAAIASFAFRKPVAAVDGNVYRVLSRVFGLTDEISSPSGKRIFRELANRLVPKARPDVYNQAIMEFGALHCTPRSPKCEECPFHRACVARLKGLQHQLPVKRRPRKPTRRNFYYFVVRQGNKLLMKQRSGNDIWKGLWDFPLYEGHARVSSAEFSRLLPRAVRTQKGMIVSPVFRHVLSHQVIHARFVEVEWPSRTDLPPTPLFMHARFFPPRKISEIPKPALVSQFLGQRGIR